MSAGVRLSKPVVAGTGFEVPNLGFVNERYAETFTGTLCASMMRAERHAAPSRAVRQRAEQYVGDVVLGNARFLDVRINGKCGFRARRSIPCR